MIHKSNSIFYIICCIYSLHLLTNICNIKYNMKQPTFRKIPTNGGGDCFFRALSIVLYNNQSHHRELRTSIIKYISEHREISQFACLGFSTDAEESVDAYCKRMSKSQHGRHYGEYADEFVIVGASEYLKRPIHIISSGYTYRGMYGSKYNTPVIYIHYAKHHFTALSNGLHRQIPRVKPYTKTKKCTMDTAVRNQLHDPRRSQRLQNKLINYTLYY